MLRSHGQSRRMPELTPKIERACSEAGPTFVTLGCAWPGDNLEMIWTSEWQLFGNSLNHIWDCFSNWLVIVWSVFRTYSILGIVGVFFGIIVPCWSHDVPAPASVCEHRSVKDRVRTGRILGKVLDVVIYHGCHVQSNGAEAWQASNLALARLKDLRSACC